MSRMLRLRLPEEMFAAVLDKAAEQGTTPAAAGRDLLAAALGMDGASTSTSLDGWAEVVRPVTDAEWASLREWAEAHPEVTYEGLTGRAAKMAHAIEKGYER